MYRGISRKFCNIPYQDETYGRKNIYKSPPKSSTLKESSELYHSKYLEDYLRSKGITWESKSFLSVTRLQEDKLTEEIWNTDSSVCYLNLLPPECIYQILLTLDLRDIFKLRIVNRLYVYNLTDEFCENKIRNILETSTNNEIWRNNTGTSPRTTPSPQNIILHIDTELRILFVHSVIYKVPFLFKSLLPIMKSRNLWSINDDLINWKIYGMLDINGTLMRFATINPNKEIIKSLLEVILFDLRNGQICQDIGINNIDICGICDLTDESRIFPLILGSIEDDILKAYLFVSSFIVRKDNERVAEVVIDELIKKLRREDLGIWIDRFSSFYDECLQRSEEYSDCFHYFCNKIFGILCRIDEYDVFVECLERYKLTGGDIGEISDEIMKIDFYPFKYVKLLGNEADEMLIYKIMLGKK